MATRQYIGAKYVPTFAQPILWDETKNYEPLTIVEYLNATYTSKRAVPAGINPNNQEYWAQTGNYSAQVEQYRQEVAENTEAFQQMSAEFDQTQAEFEKVKEDYNTIQTEYGPLKERVAENERDIAALQAGAGDQGTAIADLQEKAKNAETEIAALKITDTNLASDIQAANAEIGKTNGEVDKTNAELAKTNQTVEAVQGDITELQNITAQHTTDITGINSTVSQHTQDIADARSQITDNKQELTAHDGRITTLEDATRKQASEIGTLTTGLATANQGIADNKTGIMGNTDAINALSQRVTKNESDITANTTEIDRNKNEIAQNTSAIATHDTAIETAQNNITGLEGALSHVQQSISTLDTQVNTINGTLTDHNEQLNTQAGEIAELDAKVSQLDPKLLESANVLLNGAKGDGITDDTAAVQATIDKYHAAYFPWTENGYVLGTVNVPDNSTIYGNNALITKGDANSIFNLTGSHVNIMGLVANMDSATIPLINVPETIASINNISIKDLQLTKTLLLKTGQRTDLSYLNVQDIFGADIVIRIAGQINASSFMNLFVQQETYSDVIVINAGYDVTFEHVILAGSVAGTTLDISAGNNIRLLNSSISASTSAPNNPINFRTNNTTIDNCFFALSGTALLSLSGDHLVVSNCILGAGSLGISLFNSSYATISNCFFDGENMARQINATNCENITIKGNTGTPSTNVAYVLNTVENGVIIGNQGQMYNGVVDADSASVLVTGNSFTVMPGSNFVSGNPTAHGNLVNGTWQA